MQHHAPLPAWSYAFVLFRIGDGVSHAMLALAPLLVLGLPLWTVPFTASVMNMAAVPGSFVWGALMERTKGVGRRRLAVGGFLIAALAMTAMPFATGLPLFLLAAAAYAFFGVATAPAATVLMLEAAQGPAWADANGRLARRLGVAYLLGTGAVVALGLLGVSATRLAFGGFGAAAVLSLGAAVVATMAIEPAARITPRPRIANRRQLASPGRLFERAVWSPLRLRSRPRVRSIRMADGHPRQLLLAMFLMFTASAMLFATYPAELAAQGLGIGLILLAQIPSGLVSPWAHGFAGRFASRHGDARVLAIGAWTRLLCIPGICAVLVGWTTLGVAALGTAIVLNAVAGLSFGCLQIGGSTMLAKSHRGGAGAGIGNFHAAVSLGVLLGSTLAAAATAFLPFSWLAAAIVVLVCLGAAMALAIHRSAQFDERNIKIS